MAIHEIVVPAVGRRPARDWGLPLRVLGLIVFGLPLLVVAALLSAAMEGGLDERD